MRFQVIELSNGRYGVKDTEVGKMVFYSYSKPPVCESDRNAFSEWNNWYSANGFAQKLEAMQ